MPQLTFQISLFVVAQKQPLQQTTALQLEAVPGRIQAQVPTPQNLSVGYRLRACHLCFSSSDHHACSLDSMCSPHTPQLAGDTTQEEEPLLCIKTTATSAQCMSLGHWREEYALTSEQEPSTAMCSETPADKDSSDSVCCPGGSVSFVSDNTTECCAWRIGRRSVDDATPACCPFVDACGVCGGNGTSVDADSEFLCLSA